MLYLLFLSLKVWSWGVIGHRVVGEVADRHLTDSARQQIELILPESLADASTWADEIRSNEDIRVQIGKLWGPDKYKKSEDKAVLAGLVNAWHYMSFPFGTKLEDVDRSDKGDVQYGIERMRQVLQGDAPIQEKRWALRLLIHFVGDIHQPLHVGSGLDRGGNNCWVSWFPEKYYKNIVPKPEKKREFLKLHEVWDTTLIESRKLSATEYAKRLLAPHEEAWSQENASIAKLKKISEAKKKTWSNAKVRDWIHEARQLRPTVYLQGSQGGISRNELPKFCFKTHVTKVPVEKIPVLSWDQRYQFLKIVDQRLLKAGVRLAALLNNVFAEKKKGPP